MDYPGFRARLLRAILPALAGAALLAGPAHADSNRKGDWFTHRTRHFNIVYHPEVAAQAEFARTFLEEAHKAQFDALGLPSSAVTITVVLTGHIDESNGYATPLGHQIVIWTRPGQVIASSEMAWLRRVLAHELAHQVTFLALRNFFGIYGEIYKTANVPVWFLEGLAQYLGETWDAKRNTFFAHALYNSALEPYPTLASFLKHDPITGRLVYEQGHALVRHLAERHGGGEFLGLLLRKITVIPVWNEFKALASPITARWLPVESALLSLTGKSMGRHYREFLDSLEAGLPRGAGPGREPGPAPLVPGLEAMEFVLQARQVGPGDFIATVMEDRDRPLVSLYRSRDGRAERLGPAYVNSVFDVSPDGRRLAYVRDYTDVDGEPVNRLVVRDLAGGGEIHVSNGAYHPAFLGADTLAYSRWKSGRQVLVLCDLRGTAAACRETAPDSLVGFFALSRSSRGLLLNATDAAGRTGIWEYSPAAGFERIFQDTLLAEFPVEAPDGKIWFLREVGGLMQAVSLDRATGELVPLTAHPNGAFFLHRTAPGRIAATAQTGRRGDWRMAPVEITGFPAPDSAGYRAPAFAGQPALLPAHAPLPTEARKPGLGYFSPLEIRTLLLYPYGAATYESGVLGVGGLFQDPLALHTLQLSGGFQSDGPPVYNALYLNAQSPFPISLFSTNQIFEADSMFSAGSVTQDAVTQITVADAGFTALPPWDMPVPHSLFLSLGGGMEWHWDRVGIREDEDEPAEFGSWSRIREYGYHRLSLGYAYAEPYAWALVHPLRETFLGISHQRRYPGNEDFLQGLALQIFPVWKELTAAASYQGTWSLSDFERVDFPLPDGSTAVRVDRRESGFTHQAYGALDFPLFKDYLFEAPIFGICNFIGAGAYGAWRLEDYEASPYSTLPALEEEHTVAGGRVFFLFHMLRKIPLVWSWYTEYDFQDERVEFRLGADIGGIPSQVAGRFFDRHRPTSAAFRDRLRLPVRR